MKFTDIFIERPVLAMVISLLILIFGLRALFSLEIRQFPYMSDTVITVTTSYPGASPHLIQSFITTPIEQSVATAEGIDYMLSSSQESTSTITIYVTLNFDPNTAFTQVMSKVQAVINQLPKAAENPVITESSGGGQFALMYLGFASKFMTPEQITNYLTEVVQPQLETINGVSQAQILGGMTYAMRIWLNPQKMAAYNVSAEDVQNALLANNYQSAAGSTKGVYVAYNINASTDVNDTKGFANIIVRAQNGQIVRLKDIAKIELGSENYNSSVSFNNLQATFIGITATPIANPLQVINDVKKMLPSLEKIYPPSLKCTIVYDSTVYIRASIDEVVATIAEASIIVIIVIFLFLGNLRSVCIPVVTIPLSLIGVSSFMLALGYSINLLTLLAMVLAIGLVVDDAIVVVENISRHIEAGSTPFQAAIAGAREIANPVIAMSITLAAVYSPIGFMGGLTGALFKEFAFTLASSVILSGIIALTLSPMMCSKVLKRIPPGQRNFAHYVDKIFEAIKNFYSKLLRGSLNYRPVTIVFAITVLASLYFLYSNTQTELAPNEDQGILFTMANGPDTSNIDYSQLFSAQLSNIFANLEGTQAYFVVNGINLANNIIGGPVLKPWGDRKLSAMQLQPILQQEVNNIAGLKSSVFLPASLPGSDNGYPIEFVITSTGDYAPLFEVSNRLLTQAQNSGLFIFINNSLLYDQSEVMVDINRDKAAELGLTMQSIANALATAFGGNYTNWFSMSNRSYQVIPQVLRTHRLTPDQINQIYLKASNGDMVPLSTVVTIKQVSQPNSLSRFNQLNSATLQAVPSPGVSMGTALKYLQNLADTELPLGMSYGYQGQALQYIQEGNTLIFAMVFAIIIIFLVLAAQFESFRDPLIILLSVPMSFCAALIPLNLGLATINIYTQIGLVTLIGLISKHGILMVEFANKLQIHEGLTIREAIIKAASIRLRPILMTTSAMVVGVLPLVFATGAGAERRYCIGLVISSGMLMGTIFTLFVVPMFYTFIAKDHRHDNELANQVKESDK